MIGYWDEESDAHITTTLDGERIQIYVLIRGTSKTALAEVALGDGKCMTKLKAALCELETKLDHRFESFEVVDITRVFLGLVQKSGYAVTGLKELLPEAAKGATS